ncbi:PKD domain-containing protein [Aliikangiella coralliicola]|uniref:DUF4082 domain-containing protein n=1 Tax=Aliikangiella coralliicola TaxID=2592383 RepID=A0A545U656_9GAMM|nr:metallophosphoesterase [Aliikangiella coralliicola]TQV84960.1 DUF4082 domain-containing protein [Aliikangiella coralliicola]
MLNKFFIRIALSSLLLFQVAFIEAAVTVGPYLQNATKTSMTIHWRSSSAGVGRVTYGTDQNNLNLSADESRSTSKHIVTVTGLQPNTKYYYRVGNGSAQETPNNAAEQYFITSPNGAVKTRIWALGDAGTGTSNQNAVRDAYYNYTGSTRTNVVLALGDNAYSNGGDSDYVNKFFDVYQSMFLNTPIWSTQGNHERNQSVYEDLFTHPTNGEAGGVASGSELYYSFDYGDIHFVCLDSYSSAIDIDPGAPQYQWLEQDLQANNKSWVIAFWHHPPYSKTSGHNSDSETGMRKLRENANVLLEQYGVDVVLGGHNHSYNRSYFINGHYGVESTFNPSTHKVQNGDGGTTPYNKTDQRGAVYVMSGSAGKVTYSIDTHDANVARYYNLGSFVIDIDGDNLTGRYLRETGAIDDVFSISKTPASNSAPIANAGADASVQIPNAVNLNGSVTDDNFPGTTLTINWSQVSGPGTTTFANGNSAATTATFNTAGTYVLRLTANDGEFISTDDTTITVSAPPSNQAPVANAGGNQTIELPASATLNGSCSDDGLPVGASVSASWTGPSGVTFANPASANTTASFASDGSYVLTLSCNDTELTGINTATITVTPQQANQPPVVNAGGDFSTSSGSSTNLSGTATDDGRPSGGSLTTNWSKVSGPGNVTFGNANALNSSVTFSSIGEYVIELSANDGAATSTDTVNVIVTGNVGNDTVLPRNTTTANRRAMPFTMSETGKITSVTMYHKGGSGDMMLGVYSDANNTPGSRIGVTAITPVSATDGWQTIDLATPVQVTSGSQIWLAWIFENNPGIAYESGTPGRYHSSQTWSSSGDNMPPSFGSGSQGNYIYSIYANFTAPGAGTNNPPAFNNSNLTKASATQNVAYSDTIANDASDPDGDALTFSKISGPAWLNIASNGNLSGTPSSSDLGNNSFVAEVSDGSLSSQATVTINVNDGSTPVVISSSDFESDLGDWTNPTGEDDYDWTRDSNGTPSSNTGPSSGAGNSGFYLFLETSDGGRGAYNAGETAYLESIELSGSNRTLTFDYHMYGSQIGTLSVDVFINGNWANDVWNISGEQHTSGSADYISASVDLSSYNGTIRIRFRATAAGGWRGDMAIDNLVVTGVN